MIDQEGLLTNKQDDDCDSTGKEGSVLGSTISALKKASSVIEPKAVKTELAKLPEENKNGWAQLEQNMNKESLQKKDTIPDMMDDLSDSSMGTLAKLPQPQINLKKVESYTPG